MTFMYSGLLRCCTYWLYLVSSEMQRTL